MTNILSDGIVRVESLDDGACWRIVLNQPPANHLGDEMVAELTRIFLEAQEAPTLRATVLVGEGEHFSFGAEPGDFLRSHAASSLHAFIGLIRVILDTPVFRIAVLRGECKGRGLELARICNRVYGSLDARVGLPEIEMGVFPAVASVILPERIGRGPAGEMCCTGYVKTAQEASLMALVDHAVEDPDEFAIREVRQFLTHLSASSLRLAVRAIDLGFGARVSSGLDEVERLFVEELLSTKDAEEGVRACIEGRTPVWQHK